MHHKKTGHLEKLISLSASDEYKRFGLGYWLFSFQLLCFTDIYPALVSEIPLAIVITFHSGETSLLQRLVASQPCSFFYRGQSKRERYLAVAGACCAILVALNPTDGSGCDTLLIGSRVFYIETGGTALTSAFPNAGSLQGEIHLKSAIALFLVLAVFNLFVFTATDKFNKLQSAPNNRNKRIRNAIYRATGIAMIASLIGLGFGFQFIDCDAFDSKLGLLKIGNVCTDQHWYDAKFVDEQNWFFYLEWACLACFGISWIVKGRAGGWLLLDEKPNQIISRPSWLER